MRTSSSPSLWLWLACLLPCLPACSSSGRNDASAPPAQEPAADSGPSGTKVAFVGGWDTAAAAGTLYGADISAAGSVTALDSPTPHTLMTSDEQVMYVVKGAAPNDERNGLYLAPQP